MRIIIFFLCFIFVYSCAPKTKRHESVVGFYDIKSSGNLSFELLGGMGALTPEWIDVVADSLLLLVDRNADPAINIYNLKNLKKIASAGKRGNGPFEFITPKLEGSSFTLNDTLYAYISDFNAHILYRLNISKLLAGIPDEFEKIDDVHYTIAPGWQDMFPVNDKIVIGNLWYGDARMFIWNRNNQTVKFIPNFPEAKVHIPKDKIGYFYANFVGYNPKKKIFASAMQTFKQVDFFDSAGNHLKSLKFEKDNLHPEFKSDGSLFPPDYNFYFGRTYSTSSYFFALSQNRRADQPAPSNNFELYLFSWDQEFRGKWILSRPNIGPFTVSERNKKLYAINYGNDMEEFPIIIYNLSQLPFPD